VGITLQLADGTLLPAGGGPYQTNSDGEAVLSTNSVPSELWDGGMSFTNIYRTQIWVAICVNFLTRQVARLPLKAYERDSQNVKKPVTSGELADLLKRPAERCGPIHLKQWMTMPTLVHGNGPLRVIRRGGRAGAPPERFLPLDWRWMEPKETREGSGQLDYWILRVPNEKPAILQPDDVLHIAWAPPAGLAGVSPLQQLGVTIRSERSAQRYQEASFRNSARPSGGITLPESVAGNRELRRELRRDLIRLHQGVDNTGRPIVMPPGAAWQAFSHTAKEAELTRVREINREEIAACYSAPQPLVGILDHATYSNVAELHKILYGPVLGPWLALEESRSRRRSSTRRRRSRASGSSSIFARRSAATRTRRRSRSRRRSRPGC
jgi:HK97 family phage portal protein